MREFRFDQNEFNQFILEQGIIGFFDKPVTLSSGRISHWYANWRKATNDVFLIDTLTDFILGFIGGRKLAPDCIYGVPEGATKIAVVAQYKWAKRNDRFGKGSHRLPMGRGKPKSHGDVRDRDFVGTPNGKTLVVEDVTTTGSSLITAVDKLLEAGAEIRWVLGLTDRMERPRDQDGEWENVSERIDQKFSGRIKYLSMSSAYDLLPLAARTLKPKEKILRAVEEEFRQFGTRPLSLLLH